MRRDANPLHVAAYRESICRAQERYFDRVYGKNQLSLAQVATHPSYFRRGVAKALLTWGVELAQRERWPITVFAGPMAYGLYGGFGFTTVAIVTARVPGEEEKVEFPGMVWEPARSPRCGRFPGSWLPSSAWFYEMVRWANIVIILI
jgi:GNAT superfamily N-acetyltransferase